MYYGKNFLLLLENYKYWPVFLVQKENLLEFSKILLNLEKKFSLDPPEFSENR